MTLFSLLISCVNRELDFAVDSMRHPSLKFQWWFLVLHWLSFLWWFINLQWQCFQRFHAWAMTLFFYWFDASVMNSQTLSIPYISCHLVFSADFKVYSHSVFADDFRSVGTQLSLTIPCVNDDSIFSIDYMRQPWISIRCRFHPSAVT